MIDPALRQVSSHDSVCYDSSLYIGENTSFTRASVTKLDGSVDMDKVMGWALPVVNTSQHLEQSMANRSGKAGRSINRSRRKSTRHYNPCGEAAACSTPITVINKKSPFKKKTVKVDQGTGTASEISKMDSLLAAMLNK